MRGTLNATSISRILREVAVRRKEGVLHLVSDDVAKRIYLKDGLVIFAGSDSEEERLGAILLGSGKVSLDELTVTLEHAKRTGDTLGRVLVASGIVSHEDVEALARDRTVSIVASAFRWPLGHYYFQEKPTEVRKEVALDLAIETVLYEAVRVMDLVAVRQGLAEAETLRRCSPDDASEIDRVIGDSVGRWIFERADGANIADLVHVSPADEAETLRALYGLVLAGFVAVDTLIGSTADLGDLTLGAGSETPFELTRGAVPSELGRYEVIKLLGRGAMGAVYLAKDPAIDRRVAVKLIQTVAEVSAAEFEKYRERFHREAKAAGRLNHPGIVAVFDLGYTADATPFIVMEHVEGRTLRELVATDAPDIETILGYAIEILEPLAYAHDNGIVHRDIKPTNILVTTSGRIKLMDFGIAHVLGSELTKEHDVLGSPNYMAPEQLTKAPVDARTDLFAFGVLLYWMLTQRLPFDGDSIPAIAQSIVHDEPPPPHTIRPGVSPDLSAVVMRCLSKEPGMRFSKADDVRSSLVAAARGGSHGEATLSAIRPSSVHTGRVAAPPRGTLRRAAVTALAAGALVVAAVVLLRPPPTTETSTPPNVELSDRLDSLSDAELYQEAARTLADGDFAASRSMLTALLRRNPTFEGAAELSVQTIPDSESDELPLVAETSEVDAQLFYDARVAFDRGELEASTDGLDTLLRNNPSFVGAAQLLVDVNDAKWQRSLPRTLAVVHNHRLGECEGTVTLGAESIEFVSSEHERFWSFADIRTITMPRPSELVIETHEIELLTLGRPKNYRLFLADPMPDISWARYERLFRKR